VYFIIRCHFKTGAAFDIAINKTPTSAITASCVVMIELVTGEEGGVEDYGIIDFYSTLKYDFSVISA